MEHEHHQQYRCPMHPEVIKDAPGQCPKCGHSAPADKTSVTTAEHKHDQHAGGHAHHAGMIDDFKKRFYAVLILKPFYGKNPAAIRVYLRLTPVNMNIHESRNLTRHH